MRPPLRRLLRLYRRLRFVHWTWLLRLRLAWAGMRLEIDAPEGAVLAELPALEVETGGRRGGVLRVRLGRRVRIGRGVEIQVHAGLDNELELGDGVRVASGGRFKLRGGAIRIGARASIRDFVVIKSAGELRIGAAAILSYGVVVHCQEAVAIEEHVGIAEGVTITDSDHRLDHRRRGSVTHMPVTYDPVVIGRGTLIFAGATVLAGTVAAPGCIVAAGALLRGRYPAGSLLVGAPARVASEEAVSEPE